MRRLIGMGIVAAVAMVLGAGVQAGGDKGHEGKGHVMIKPDELKWGPSPPAFPAGGMISVVYGDPSKPGPYVVRFKAPAGYKIPAHWHPAAENVTVLKGTFYMGKGDKLDEKTSEAMPVGSFVHMPKEMRHFAWCKDECMIQVHGVGPFEITYVNPDDDPRKK